MSGGGMFVWWSLREPPAILAPQRDECSHYAQGMPACAEGEEIVQLQTVVRVLVFALGLGIIALPLISAVRTIVLPRGANDRISRIVFTKIRVVFDWIASFASTYQRRDRIMAFFAPIAVLSLPIVWLMLVCAGYTLLFWATGVPTWHAAFVESGSSLLTLGFSVPATFGSTVLAFSEAILGLGLVALLISYLPTIYQSFSRREAAVTLLEVRAGSPPSAIELILRYHRIQGMERAEILWPAWEAWFGELEETHTSLGVLAFFRSPNPARSWVTAAGAILDAAALFASTLDTPRDAQQDLCIRAGYIALRSIADFYRIPFNAHPKPDGAISISRAEYDEACERLLAGGVALKPDRDRAWSDFAGWRVNYDDVLLSLANLTMAPIAPWSSDRAHGPFLPALGNKPKKHR